MFHAVFFYEKTFPVMDIPKVPVYIPYGNGDGCLYDIYYVRSVDEADG